MPSLIQKKTGSNSNVTTLALTMAAGVSSGNIVVMAAAPLKAGTTVPIVSGIRTSGDVWTRVVNTSKVSTDSADSEIWYTIPASGGWVTASVDFSLQCIPSCALYEINGYYTSGIKSGTGTGVTAGTTTLTVGSITPLSGSFVIATGSSDGVGAGAWTKDAAFSVADNITTHNNNQYQTSWGGAATTGTLVTPAGGSSNLPWAETLAYFPASGTFSAAVVSAFFQHSGPLRLRRFNR